MSGEQLGDVSELYEERPCLYNFVFIDCLVQMTPFP